MDIGARDRGERSAVDVKGLLAVLFLFAGGAKLVMSATRWQDGGAAVLVLRFIGAAEVLARSAWSFPGFAHPAGPDPAGRAGLVSS